MPELQQFVEPQHAESDALLLVFIFPAGNDGAQPRTFDSVPVPFRIDQHAVHVQQNCSNHAHGVYRTGLEIVKSDKLESGRILQLKVRNQEISNWTSRRDSALRLVQFS